MALSGSYGAGAGLRGPLAENPLATASPGVLTAVLAAHPGAPGAAPVERLGPALRHRLQLYRRHLPCLLPGDDGTASERSRRHRRSEPVVVLSPGRVALPLLPVTLLVTAAWQAY